VNGYSVGNIDTISSATGQSINTGTISFIPPPTEIIIIISQDFTTFIRVHDDTNNVQGTWTFLEVSVPEPASAVQAGIAIAIGLALAAFRKRKEARRQRPLDANQ
jgi:hypothetical protein